MKNERNMYYYPSTPGTMPGGFPTTPGMMPGGFPTTPGMSTCPGTNPGFGVGGTDLNARITKLEREVRRLDQRVSRLEGTTEPTMPYNDYTIQGSIPSMPM